jgi:hypothetical protein
MFKIHHFSAAAILNFSLQFVRRTFKTLNYCTKNHVNPNYYFLPPLHKFNVVMSANLAQKQRSLRKKAFKMESPLT